MQSTRIWREIQFASDADRHELDSWLRDAALAPEYRGRLRWRMDEDRIVTNAPLGLLRRGAAICGFRLPETLTAICEASGDDRCDDFATMMGASGYPSCDQHADRMG